MNSFFYFLLIVAVLLELLLLWRIQREQMWHRYPLFLVYLCFDLGRTVVLFGVMNFRSAIYKPLYWYSESIAIVLRFFIVWEIFRNIFMDLAIHRGVSKALRLAFFGSVIVFLTARISDQSKLFFPDMERKLGCVQVVLLVLILLTARYYRIMLGRNVWGMAVGFGIYVSISMANFSAIELARSFFHYWQLIGPVSFVVMLAVWTWGLWVYAPNPILRGHPRADAQMYLDQWKRIWDRMLMVLKKVL